jgi:hypothetical protein
MTAPIDPRFLKSAVHFAERLAVHRDAEESCAVAAATYAKYGVTADAIMTEWTRQLMKNIRRLPPPAPVSHFPGLCANSGSGDAGRNPESPREASASAAGTTTGEER